MGGEGEAAPSWWEPSLAVTGLGLTLLSAQLLQLLPRHLQLLGGLCQVQRHARECQLLLQVTSVTEPEGSEAQTRAPVCPHLPLHAPQEQLQARHQVQRPSFAQASPTAPTINSSVLYNRPLISLTLVLLWPDPG